MWWASRQIGTPTTEKAIIFGALTLTASAAAFGIITTPDGAFTTHQATYRSFSIMRFNIFDIIISGLLLAIAIYLITTGAIDHAM
jgi:hypothetical protein